MRLIAKVISISMLMTLAIKLLNVYIIYYMLNFIAIGLQLYKIFKITRVSRVYTLGPR